MDSLTAPTAHGCCREGSGAAGGSPALFLLYTPIAAGSIYSILTVSGCLRKGRGRLCYGVKPELGARDGDRSPAGVFWWVGSRKGCGDERRPERTPVVPLFSGVRDLSLPDSPLARLAPPHFSPQEPEKGRAGYKGWGGHSHAVMCVRGQGSA